jgi:hypothetical protein
MPYETVQLQVAEILNCPLEFIHILWGAQVSLEARLEDERKTAMEVSETELAKIPDPDPNFLLEWIRIQFQVFIL